MSPKFTSAPSDLICGQKNLSFSRTAIVRAHLGAVVVAGKERQSAAFVILRQGRKLYLIQVVAEIHTGYATGVRVRMGLLLQRPHDLETRCHARPAFFFV
jgi:hypothetical protein